MNEVTKNKAERELTQFNDYFLNPNYSIEELEQRLEMEEQDWCLIYPCSPTVGCAPICEPVCESITPPPCPSDNPCPDNLA